MSAMNATPLVELGWGGPFEAHFSEHAAAGLEPGRVVATHRETAIVRLAAGTVAGYVSGRFRRAVLGPADYPAVGDWVAVEPRLAERSATIHAVLPRRSAILRTAGDSNRLGGGRLVDEQVLAANVDVAFVVASIAIAPNLRRLERYLALAWASGTTPVVVLNKADLAADAEASAAVVAGVAIGAAVHPVSALGGIGLEPLAAHLRPGTTTVVIGPSGVGKSTLVNALLGEERQVTRAIREADGRGRHTTTHRELFVLPGGGLLVDTPGLREFGLWGEGSGIAATFADIDALAPECRYRDCRHADEPGCAVRQAVDDGRLDPERLASFHKLAKELAFLHRQVDARAALEEKRRWKSIHKMAKKFKPRA